jgi:dolichol-phosphate mannosyltransferase
MTAICMAELLSIVVPCFNEAGNIPGLHERLSRVLNSIPAMACEIICVDDGSTDNTNEVLRSLRERDSRIGILRFVRNFGHQAALNAGLRHARGTAVIMMDADLQHPPEMIPQLIEKWRGGYDVVQTIRRSQPGLTKSLTSRAFYTLMRSVSEVELEDGAADFRLMSRRAVDALLALPEHTRFLRGLVTWLGFPTAQIEFDAPPRTAGDSGYSFRKMLGLAEDAVVSLSSRPLRFSLYIAVCAIVSAILYAAYILQLSYSGQPVVRGWPSTILSILMMGSANLICTGILGIYLRAVLRELRGRPDYIIAEYHPPAQPSMIFGVGS